MKKIIFLCGILFCQFEFGMSNLQKVVRAYLENPDDGSNFYSSSSYGFNSENVWLLRDIVDCSDYRHKACSRMRVYFQNYVPIMCQRDPYYSSQKTQCNFFYDLLVDQQFVQGLMKDHWFTEVEAEYCAKKLAAAFENAEPVK